MHMKVEWVKNLALIIGTILRKFGTVTVLHCM
jgi:hypothetical protein